MKRSILFTMSLLLLFLLLVCSVSSISQTIDPRLEDLNDFCKTLEKRHKNLFARISKREFEMEKQKITEKIPEMSDSEFYYSLKHLLSLVGDAHTTLAFSDSQYKHLSALGFAIAKFNDNWHLMILEKENEKYLGSKLIAINDVDISEVYNRAKGIMSYENEVWAENNFSNTINFREALEYLGIVEKGGPIVLKVEDSSGNRELLDIKSMNEEEIMNAQFSYLVQHNTPKTVLRGYYSAMEINKNAYYIQYNSCQEAPDLPMKEFISFVSEVIKENYYKKVIIDLRYNSGGNSSIFEPMISELSKLQKKKDFTVYTIIGRNTFSSAIINAIQIDDKLNNVFVGTPTGGNVNGYGEIKSFNLKNTPITVLYSTKYFELIKGYEKDSLYPDIFVEQSFEDYLNGVDTVVEMILQIED